MTYVLSYIICLPLWARSIPVYLKPNNPAPTGHFGIEQLKQQPIQYDRFEWIWVRDSKGNQGWMLKSKVLLPLDFSRQAVLKRWKNIYEKPNHESSPKRLFQSQIVTLVERHHDWYKIIYRERGKKKHGWVLTRNLKPYSKDGGYFFSKVKTRLRREPRSSSKVITSIKPGQPIIPLHAKGDWALVEIRKRGYIPFKNPLIRKKDGDRLFLKVKTRLRKEPGSSSKVITSIKQGQPIILLHTKGDWALVKIQERGYIPFKNLLTRMDVALKIRTDKGYFKPHPSLHKQKILEIFSNPVWVGTGLYPVELKSRPDMGSKTLTILEPWESIILQGYSVKRWVQSQIPGWGAFWWPESTTVSNVEITKSFGPTINILKKSDVQQMIKSPVIPSLRFASTTHGVYRSFDGQSWYPIGDFKEGLPIKIARNGTLFITDKVSFDHGESFHHFIRWDKVFDSLPERAKQTRGPVQIIDISPSLNNHKRVVLSLKLGTNRYLQFQTHDLGQNWHLL